MRLEAPVAGRGEPRRLMLTYRAPHIFRSRAGEIGGDAMQSFITSPPRRFEAIASHVSPQTAYAISKIILLTEPSGRKGV